MKCNRNEKIRCHCCTENNEKMADDSTVTMGLPFPIN